MNAAPLSTQFPVPNLGDSQSAYNPAEFIVFLRSLNNNHLGDHCLRIPSNDKDNWTTIVDGLVDHFLRSFYLPDTVSWDGVQERLELTEVTLEVLRRVFLRVDGIFTGSEALVRKIFVRLMDFSRVLDLWIESITENADGLSKLQQYREMVMSVLISVLRGLGRNNPVPGQQQSACESLREMLTEGLEVCRDIFASSAPLSGSTTLAFFGKPRILSAQSTVMMDFEAESNPLHVVINVVSQVPPFLTVILEAVTRTVSPPLQYSWFLADILRVTSEHTCSLLLYYMSSTCPATSAVRLQCISRIISATNPLRQRLECKPVLDTLPKRLFQFRLECSLELDWATIDPVLLNFFQAEGDLLVVKELVLSVIQRLGNGPISNELKDLVRAYLHLAVQKLDPEFLTSVKESVEQLPASTDRDDLLRHLTGSPWLSSSAPVMNKTKSQKGRLVMAPHIWRQRVQNLVQEIIAPDSLHWMDDDDGMSASHVCRRSLQEIQIRFEQRPLHSTASEYRLEFLHRLSELPCVLAQCDKSDCFSQTNNNKYLAISPYTRVFITLLNGPNDEVTPQVRMKTFLALVFVLAHHDGVDSADSIVEFIFRGLADIDRSVRLSAGRALASLIRNYALHGKEGYARAEIIFSKVYQFFDNCKNPSRETLLITVAYIGKDANQDILGQVLGLIIAQLGRQSLVVRGLAAMQIASLAKHHQKTPYALILPHQEKLALFMVSRLPVQPNILYETCKIMSIAPSDFINITLQHTLPVVCGNCDRNVLDYMAKEVPHFNKVLANHLPAILAHIFLLPNQLLTTTALSFLEKVIGDDSETSLMLSVIKVHVYSLLASLMVKVGDEDPRISERAISAFRRVQAVLEPTMRGQRKIPDIRELLRTYMLGLVSQINDMLQDVHGKKSVDVKRKIIRGLGFLVEQIGESINNASPQIMATFQTMVGIPELSEVTLESWYKFLTTLGPGELGAHIGPTSAAIVASWKILSPQARTTAYQALEYIVTTEDTQVREYLCDVADLRVIDQLKPLSDQLTRIRSSNSPKEELQRILEQVANDNSTVVIQALQELKSFLLRDEHSKYIQEITSGDMFDPMAGQILASLLLAACRDHSHNGELLKLLSFECIGVLGAIDPDRCEMPSHSAKVVILKNFTDEEETTVFALHLIQDLLVGAFRATSDIKYQNSLAYGIQELLAFCRFTPAVVANRGGTVSMKTRKLWNSLPKHVLETVTPLLAARYTVSERPTQDLRLLIYPQQSTYREWIQLWAIHLISKTSGPMSQKLFSVFRSAVRSRDVVVAHHLLPHLVLHVLISGNDDAEGVRAEMISVLQDQVDSQSNSTSDKKLLSAQAVFILLDHINKWVRIVRQELAKKADVGKRARGAVNVEEQLARVDSILSSIDQTLMAKAAFKCKAFARSLMNFEQRIVVMKARGTSENQLPDYYEKLHEIYAQLDEPDGMEGVSTLILAPTLEHQIREHESTGRWTSAQSCWEVRLQESPDDVEFHLGLLRCLRNLGHYDTLRTHVAGVLTRHPEWETVLSGFQAESAWMVGAWSDVRKLVESVDTQNSSVVIARVLLAMREGNSDVVETMLSQARLVLGAPTTAAGVGGYRRSYEAALDLHLTHELEMIYKATCTLPQDTQSGSRQERRRMTGELSKTLSRRLDLTLPTFRSREPVLSMRRIAFTLSKKPLIREIGESWLASAKIARKSKQWQTAYSAMLQAQQRKMPYCFIESARLLKATGEPLRALNELESSSTLLGLFSDQVVDLTADAESDRMKAKILILRARWMNDCDRFDSSVIFSVFQEAANVQKKWESAHYYLGQYHDECFKALSPADQATRGLRMNTYTVRSYIKAITYGSKFVYQTVPRMLTIWLDVGEDKRACQDDSYKKMTDFISKAFRDAPVYKWFTAFPQIVSRVGHDNTEVYKHLSALIVTVMQAYPLQALWLFTSVIKSTKRNREQRGHTILNQLQNNPRNQRTIQKLVQQSISMTNELLALCDRHLEDGKYLLGMSKDFPELKRMGRCDLIVPLQESLTASLPPTPETESTHHPFPLDTPTFHEFSDEIEVMKSLAKPRKITIRGSNGQTYMFLGKPKDDLRKDARLMDLNAIINKLLKGNSESRKRQLHIRTYGVVTLNEECGFIQWVPNTTPIRPILNKYYDARRIRSWSSEMDSVFKKVKEANEKQGAELFKTKILSMFLPVFHEWFIETFPEPTAWLSSRLTYGRTLAVMSMVGFILGLGDRHCENILMDLNTGDVVHVDFNCLFEKGKSLDTPERVPFRLTQNITDGLGVIGVEGVFRVACEVTLQLLRDNRDSLMSVLDAFVHDPLVEWEDEKRRMDREPSKRTSSNTPKVKTDLRVLAKQALNPVEKKLKGIYSTNSKERIERELSTSNLVQMLIQEATDLSNLARMYPGWAAWH